MPKEMHARKKKENKKKEEYVEFWSDTIKLQERTKISWNGDHDGKKQQEIINDSLYLLPLCLCENMGLDFSV